MKKISMLLAGLAVGQVLFAQNVQFGLKGGLNIANIKDDRGKTDEKLAFHLGGLAHIHLSSNFALQPEVVYSRQGAEYNLPEINHVGEHKTNYINIPVLGQYMNNGGLRLQTGPQLGILTSSKFEHRNEGESELPTNNVDFSWSFGAGYLSNSGLGVDARYNHGISNVHENFPLKAKNRVFQLGLFYQFNK